jgi:hypothetical protein
MKQLVRIQLGFPRDLTHMKINRHFVQGGKRGATWISFSPWPSTTSRRGDSSTRRRKSIHVYIAYDGVVQRTTLGPHGRVYQSIGADDIDRSVAFDDETRSVRVRWTGKYERDGSRTRYDSLKERTLMFEMGISSPSKYAAVKNMFEVLRRSGNKV